MFGFFKKKSKVENKLKNEPKKETKKKEVKNVPLKASESTPITFNPQPKKPNIIQPSSTIPIQATGTQPPSATKEKKEVEKKVEIKLEGEEEGEGEAEQEQQQEEEVPQTLVEMKKGDYNVHILIEEVKNLISVEENVPPVPRVKMTVFDKVKRTTKMKKPCFDFTFNEHFYYDKTNLTVEMLDSEKIILEVYDNKNAKREDYFGIYEVDFAYVYGKPNHCMKNTWIGLSNPESDDITKVRGYLKLSISVLNENDNRVELEPNEGGEENCIMPNQIKMKYKQISFYFIRGVDFPDMDSYFTQYGVGDRSCQGYIVIKYMGIERKTKVVDMKLIGDHYIVNWNQVIDIPATYPCVSQKICMTIYDEDTMDADDIVGSYEFYVNDIYEKKYEKFDYIHIYGSPLNKDTKQAILMGNNAEIASFWNGKVFMKCEVKDIDSPVALVRNISENSIIKEAEIVSSQPKYKWEVWIRIMSALYLPKPDKKYKIKAMVEANEGKTNDKKAVNSSIDFNETIIIKFESLYPDLDKLPDLFLYLRDPKNRIDYKNICFQRIKLQEFYKCQDVLYIKLLPDPVINKVKTMHKSGLLKCKICLFNSKTDKPPEKNEFDQAGQYQLATLGSGGKYFVGNQQNMQFYKIVALIYMSKELIAAESSGTSDPYVTLTLAEKTLSTTAKHNTMNGVWNEPLEFEQIYMDVKDQRTWPVFLLNVYDKNKYLKDVPLGYNYLWLSNSHFAINSYELVKPKWHDLFLPKSNKKQGKILISFYIFDQNVKERGEQLFKKISYLPKTMLYNFDISVLGLRELKPLGLIGIKKPFIKFDLNSLNVTGKPEDDHAPVKTIPVSGGENPTINTVIQFETKLPIQEEFLPELQCEVYDNILSGMANSLLGVFSFNLKKIIKRTRIQIQEDIDSSHSLTGKDLLGKGLLGMLNIINFPTNKMLNNNNNNIINTNINNNNIINTNIINTNINTNIINSNNNILGEGEGMKEKDDNHEIKIEPENSQNNIINENNVINPTSSQDALSTSNMSSEFSHKESNVDDENEKFLEDDDNKFVDSKTNGKIDFDKIKGSQLEFTVIPKGQKVTLANSIKLGWDFLKDNLHDSHYFVIFPTPMNFHIPGYAVDVQGTGEGEQKVQKELLIEDPYKVPDPQIYFKIGYMLKYQEGLEAHQMTKHYRRIYRGPLENFDLKEFNMETPFNVRKIRRGKYVDKRSETELFDAMKSVNSKIIHKFGKDNSINDVDMNQVLTYKNFSNFEEHKKKKEEKKEQKAKKKEEKKNKMNISEKKGEKAYGKFKGLVRVTEHDLAKKYEKAVEEAKKNAEITKTELRMKNYNKYNELKQKILNRKEVIIRVYILELNELAQKDLLSDSDPYVKLYLNNKLVVNEKKNHQDDQKNCKWYKYYDIPGEMPGSSNLKIEVMDYDDLLSDDLIGYTIIDLEDRYFNTDWQNLVEKPVEIRPLVNLDFNGAQGYVYMWLEIFESSLKSQMEPWQIAPEPITEFEVRFVVWETEDMEMMDVEGTSDIYIVGYIGQNDSQKTDIHFRCQDGNASFNWRMLLPLQLPTQKPLLTIQVYDKDIFSSDDYISGATLNLKDLLTLPKYLDMPVKFTKSYYEGLSEEEQKVYGDIEFLSETDDEDGIKFWVQCYKGKKEATGEGAQGGRVLCTLEILPKALADKNKLGKGRSNPNKDPYCPPPTGRFECSLNPCKIINQCVGPKFRKKCYCYIIMCLVIVYLIIAMPNIIGKILSP